MDKMLAPPPVNKVAVIGIWVENVLYGVTCVFYGLCVFVLLCKDKAAPLRRMLLAMSTILFLLSTVYIGASLRQLLEAFVYAPVDIPDYSTSYWLNLVATPRVLKDALYGPLVLAQDVILIWRLYVVFSCRSKVIIVPIILAACHVGTLVAAAAVSTLPSGVLYSSSLTSLIIPAWVFGFILNTSVTTSIVIRLWRLGRTLAAPSTNRFASPIYMVIESGAISSITHVFLLAFFASNNPAALFVLDIAAQLTALTPLLIVVQVAAGRDRIFMGDLLSSTSSKVHSPITFQAYVPRDSGVRMDSVIVLQKTADV